LTNGKINWKYIREEGGEYKEEETEKRRNDSENMIVGLAVVDGGEKQ